MRLYHFMILFYVPRLEIYNTYHVESALSSISYEVIRFDHNSKHTNQKQVATEKLLQIIL